MNPNNFREWLTQAGREIGAHSVACLRMDNPRLRRTIADNNIQVSAWLQNEMHGEMEYLERMFPEKSNPWNTYPFAKSVIVLSFNNLWGDPAAKHPFPEPAKDALLGYISAYAREDDYHFIGQAMLSKLTSMLGENIRAAATVDTAAVYERLFATVAGLGVVGGNSLLRVSGSGNTRVFIGCLFVDIELPEVIHEAQMPFACATCHACVKNCPTGAIQVDQPIDARKCISYLTIEKRGPLSQAEGRSIGRWLFGCDGCTLACPPRPKTDMRIPIDLEWLLQSSAAEIRRTIKGNATAYAGVTQLRRNAVVILKNMETRRAQEVLRWTRENSGSELIRQQIDLW
ncbi:epoxyqueuosine reductase [Desulfuromusa kysingii]|uniref:Epoxyqueuosine reductase n=1 Tax=Desulfuromusa kysingii TaxID=37625 RepID=A0A1H4C497_9BACT|nr:QueG-associated DUF1730 domain-containing protein [Desulfuromusa kysingii]SEA55157.1 epoxyqueuosine reductase [Desulfuromusa kysingii]